MATQFFRIALAITLFILTFAHGGVAGAQRPSIAYNESVTGWVTTNGSAEWGFYANAGSVIRVDVTRLDTNLDPYVRVLDPFGSVVASDDDSGGNLNSRIGSYRVSSNGWHTIRVTPYSGGGSFQLSLSATNPPTCDSSIAYGARHTGTIGNATGIRYCFRGGAGDWVEITMSSQNMDTYLELYAPDGRMIASNDDRNGSTNSRIYLDDLPATGNYVIVARGYSGDTGSFSLTLD